MTDKQRRARLQRALGFSDYPEELTWADIEREARFLRKEWNKMTDAIECAAKSAGLL